MAESLILEEEEVELDYDETGLDDPEFTTPQRSPTKREPSVGKARMQVCPTCRERKKSLKVHVLNCHLPWFWEPRTACWECHYRFWAPGQLAGHIRKTGHHSQFLSQTIAAEWTNLVNGALRELCYSLRLATPDTLLFHYQEQLSPDLRLPAHLIMQDSGLRGAFIQYNGLKEGLKEEATTLAALLHWRVVAMLASQ